MKDTDKNTLKNLSHKSGNDLILSQNMLDISIDILCAIDTAGKFQYASKSCFSILGYTQTEMCEMALLQVVHPEELEETKRVLNAVLVGESITHIESNYLHKNGDTIPTLWSAKWDEGTDLMFCTIKDASDMKRLQREKKEEYINKEALINLTDTVMWSFDKELNLLSANEAFINSVKELTGKIIKKGQNLLDESFFSVVHLRHWEQPYHDVLMGKSSQTEMEVPSLTPPETIWIKTEFKPIKENNKVIGGVCRAYHITQAKKNEIEIIELNEQLKENQKMAHFGYWELYPETESIFWSDEVYKIWEIEEGTTQLDYNLLLKTIHPDDLAYYEYRHERALQGIESIDNLEYRIITKGGKIKWVREIGGLVKKEYPNKSRFKGIVQEITYQKEVEVELKNRNKFIESIFQHIPMGIAVNKLSEGTTLLMNKEFSEIYGWPKDVLTDVKTFFNRVYPDPKYRKKMTKIITTAIESGDINKMQWKDISITTQTGEKKYVDARNIPLVEQDLMISTVLDVTDKVKSEMAMETALKERNIVLESISDAFYALNEHFEFTYINQTALKLFDKPEKTLLGQNLFTAFPELKNTVFYTYLKEVKKEGKPRTFEFYYELYDLWFDENIYPTEDGFSVFFKDITERKLITKELQNAYEKNQEILESISDAFYALDKDYNFIYFNAEAEKLLQISRHHAIGKNKWELFKQSKNTKIHFEYIAALETQETHTFEYYYPPFKTWFLFNAYPSENGLSVYFRDINDEKQRKRKLKTLNKELKARAKELEYINKELEQFAFIASHDLQEPLRMITGFMSQLKNKFGGELNEKANTYIDFAVDGGERMRQIIIDLLEYSRAGTELNYTEKIDLNNLVIDIISLNRNVIHKKQAEIAIENLPEIYFDKIGIREVFQNLLSNALKYCKNGVVPNIKINYLEHDKEFQFTVSDNGIGIKNEYLDKIFIIFQRLHNKNEFGGTGLGLAICKKIVEKGGGRIWVDSVHGEGTAFHFTIPK